jgi:hypothetical protein
MKGITHYPDAFGSHGFDRLPTFSKLRRWMQIPALPYQEFAKIIVGFHGTLSLHWALLELLLGVHELSVGTT